MVICCVGFKLWYGFPGGHVFSNWVVHTLSNYKLHWCYWNIHVCELFFIADRNSSHWIHMKLTIREKSRILNLQKSLLMSIFKCHMAIAISSSEDHDVFLRRLPCLDFTNNMIWMDINTCRSKLLYVIKSFII